MSALFPGADLYRLQTTRGLPLSFSLDAIINTNRLAVDWVAYMVAARKGGQWDYQTVQQVEHGLRDAEVDAGVSDEIMKRLKLWVYKNPHPGLAA